MCVLLLRNSTLKDGREIDLELTSEMVEMFEFVRTLEQISCFGQLPGISMEAGDWTQVKKMFIKGEGVGCCDHLELRQGAKTLDQLESLMNRVTTTLAFDQSKQGRSVDSQG